MARFCRERGFEPRYIEFMPLDSQALWDRKKVLLADDMIAMISREIGPLEAVPDARSARSGDGIPVCGRRRAASALSPP